MRDDLISGREPRRGTLSPAKIAEITEAVRAFCVVYHTSLMYRADHAVLRSAVEERIPLIQRAIEGLPALSLNFAEGQIRAASQALEPGSGVFQRMARAFEVLGVSNLTFLPGMDSETLIRLIAILSQQADAIRQEGLAAVLKREHLSTVASIEKTLQSADGDGGGKQQATKAGGKGGGVWEIGDSLPDLGSPEEPVAAAPEQESPHPRSARDFVAGVLGAMARREADEKAAAELIAVEFEHRIEEQVAAVRRESEKRIRRLETVKELILKELERMSIAAVIVDTGLRVLAMNAVAEELFGRLVQAIDSPLEDFIRSGAEKQDLEIRGQKHVVRLVTKASGQSGEDLMLVTVERRSASAMPEET